MTTRKRKHETALSEPKTKVKTFTCILHVPGHEKDPFTPLSSTKIGPNEKLVYLQDIRDKRLAQPLDSPLRMDDVCEQIPISLECMDIDKIGYHRKCYQMFTKNLDRLQGLQAGPSTSGKHHSPRKCRSSEPCFPEECIFCAQAEIKVAGKTERLKKFT